MNVMTLKDKWVLITGASSGFGAAAARAFGAEGSKLLLGARRLDRLEQVAALARRAGAPEAHFPGPDDEGVHTGCLADIEGMEMGFRCTRAAGQSGDLLQAIEAAGAEQEFGTFRAKSAGCRGAEAAGGTSDQNPFILQRHDVH